MTTVEKFAIAAGLVILVPLAITFFLRNPLRRAIIVVAEFIVILATIMPTVVALFAFISGIVSIWHVLAIGVGGTLIACLIAATFLALSDIAKNTRRMLAYYEPEAQQQHDDYTRQR